MTLKRKVRITREHNSDGTHTVVAEAANADTVDNFNASQTAGTANTILVAGSDGTMPVQPIWDYTVSGSAITTVTTNGTVTLDGHAHGGYRIEFTFINISGGTPAYRLYINNDTTGTNYDSAHAVVANWNDAFIENGLPNNYSSCLNGDLYIGASGIIWGTGHYMRKRSSTYMYGAAWSYHKIATVANLTRIDIVSSVANGIGIGSRFRLWRRL